MYRPLGECKLLLLLCKYPGADWLDHIERMFNFVRKLSPVSKNDWIILHSYQKERPKASSFPTPWPALGDSSIFY